MRLRIDTEKGHVSGVSYGIMSLLDQRRGQYLDFGYNTANLDILKCLCQTDQIDAGDLASKNLIVSKLFLRCRDASALRCRDALALRCHDVLYHRFQEASFSTCLF